MTASLTEVSLLKLMVLDVGLLREQLPVSTRMPYIGGNQEDGKAWELFTNGTWGWAGIWKEIGIERHDDHPRVHSGWIVLNSCGFVLHNVYLPPASSLARIQEASDVCDEVLRRAQAVQCTLSDWPGVAGVPTNRASQGEHRQLDGILISPSMGPLLEGFRIIPMEGLSTHDAVVADVSVPCSHSVGTKLAPTLLDVDLLNVPPLTFDL